MEPDFSGYATKAGLKCTDGRTIMPEAFAHQDSAQVPLVWQHGHQDPENVLGHAILEKRNDGVYAYGFFNDSQKAKHARGLLEHKDIKMLSIWANDLIERGGRVLHGAIREVSLVLSGANPGALIENVTIRHSDETLDTIDDEAIIYTGLELELGEEVEHSDLEETVEEQVEEPVLTHAEDDGAKGSDEETIADVYNTLTDKQKDVVHYMIGEALDVTEEGKKGGEAKQDAMSSDEEETEENIDETDNAELQQDNMTDDTEKEGTEMSNVFEKGDDTSPETYELSHADVEGIVADASKRGSLKDAVEDFALQHGITDIDVLFPEAKALASTPEFDKRRTEWVQSVLGGVSKSPFSRIKTLSANLTLDEARAKGYVKGSVKKEEFFGVQKRTTTPTTMYKKQQLDRDDMIDITDFDVVAWLKGEMRLMLDEELARAILLGDGRDVTHEDKIQDGTNGVGIRPIVSDHDLYTTQVGVDLATGAPTEAAQGALIIDAVIANRRYYKGSGQPTFFTSESVIAKFLLMKDGFGRRLYNNLGEVASELRCKAIVPVEVMDEMDPDSTGEWIGVLVNPSDYVVGADAGGQISMFDDFDIDMNQYKYLIETRVSGALTKIKSAIALRGEASGDNIVAPNAPTFVSATGIVTIVATTGVSYYDVTNDPGRASALSAGAYDASLSAGESIRIEAVADSGYYLAGQREFNFTMDPA